MLKNFGQMMKQAKEIQARIEEAQARIATLEATGTSGGGLVEVTLSGKSELKRLKVDPSLFREGDAEMLSDLVVAAHNDARAKVAELVHSEIGKATGGLSLPPGFGLPI
ncbi:MAG: YbaB/EbfC family nucleoid-associated protein [Alphaproteobacteria bacterium]|nr:YbaB/EbfC family nucleoid-associated protein [Alphaproteobacteria bacterium]